VSVQSEEQALDEVIENLQERREQWIAEVVAVILGFPLGTTFISDDLFERVSPCPGDPRTMGAAVRAARSKNLIHGTGVFRKSARPGCHANLVSEWERV
jgi:hypothetical protein